VAAEPRRRRDHRVEHRLSKEDPTLVDLQPPDQKRGDSPPSRDRARGSSFRASLVLPARRPPSTRAAGGFVPDATETAERNGDDPPREGKGGCRHLSQPRGLQAGKDGRIFTEGEDLNLARAVPGIDVHQRAQYTEVHDAIIVNGRTPVVQTGKYGETSVSW